MVMMKKDVVRMLNNKQEMSNGLAWMDASSECIGTSAPSFVSDSWTVNGKQYNARVKRSDFSFMWRASLECGGKTVWRSSVQHAEPEQAINELQKLAGIK